MHYYVVGVNGSGKTTLLKAIHDKAGLPVVHGTSELMSYLGIPGDYDALRKIDQASVLVEWGKTAEHLVGQYAGKDLLLDTHILNLTHGKVIRRDGPWIGTYDALVLIKAQPATLLKRIEADVVKDRAMFEPDMSEAAKLALITRYQAETETLFAHLCDTYKLPSLLVNNDIAIEDSVQTFISFTKRI
jgi:adenylate kinase